jgi:hypothetical protein
MKSAELQQNLEVLASMSSAPDAIFQLLVAVSGILRGQDYDRLGPILWKYFLDSAEAVTLGPVRKLLTPKITLTKHRSYFFSCNVPKRMHQLPLSKPSRKI